MSSLGQGCDSSHPPTSDCDSHEFGMEAIWRRKKGRQKLLWLFNEMPAVTVVPDLASASGHPICISDHSPYSEPYNDLPMKPITSGLNWSTHPLQYPPDLNQAIMYVPQVRFLCPYIELRTRRLPSQNDRSNPTLHWSRLIGANPGPFRNMWLFWWWLCDWSWTLTEWDYRV